MVHPSRLTDEAWSNSIVEMIGRKSPDIFAAQINALLAGRMLTPVLAALKCPTMMLCGREDALERPRRASRDGRAGCRTEQVW